MWNEPTIEDLRIIPRLYSTENTPIEEKIVVEHFFILDSDFYIIEYDGSSIFWGFVLLNNDFQNAEFGYISFYELKAMKIGFLEVDRDLYWEVRPVKHVSTIMEARA